MSKKNSKKDNNKEHQIIDLLGTILLCISIAVFSLIIGANQKNLPVCSLGILTGIGVILLVILKIKYKERLLKGKLDWLVTAFMGTLLLPLIFKTFCSYQGTLEFIFKYFFIYTMYILARNVINTEKKKNALMATTIITSLFTIIFGLDMLHGNYLEWLVNKLNLGYTQTYRFSSTFGYANAASLYVMFCVFLSVTLIEKNKNLAVRVLCALYILLATYIIYISYSRVILLLYTFSIFVYVVSKVYNKVKTNKKLIKGVAIGGACAAAVFIIYIALAFNYSKPYKLEEVQEFRRSFEPNTEYTISLDVSLLSDISGDEEISIQILETNNYFMEKELDSQKISKDKQNYEFKVTTSDELYQLKINPTMPKNTNMTIDNCYINGEKYIFEYKYIPKIIARLITTFSLNDDSIVLRRHYYENCLRIAKDSLLIGHGGNAWHVLYLAYQDYPYIVKEAHSFFFELLISYGLIGTIAFLAMFIWFSYKQIKNFLKNNGKDAVTFWGLCIVILYSLLFDFSMSFIIILLIAFVYMAALNNNIEDENKTISDKNILWDVIEYGIVIGITVLSIMMIRTAIAQYFVDDNKTKVAWAPHIIKYQIQYLKDNSGKQTSAIKDVMEKEPYINQNELYTIYWHNIYDNIKTYSEKELIEDLKFGIDQFEKNKPVSQMFFLTMAERVNIMADVVSAFRASKNTKIQSELNRLKLMIKDEYEVNEKNIVDLSRNGITKEESEKILNNYRELLKAVNIEV